MLGGQVAFDVPVDVAYAYLAYPRHRPEWQSSLRSVQMLDEGEPRVGMRWHDHTVVGIVPRMVITALERGEQWAEQGRWRAIEAVLILGFEPAATGCVVDVRFRVNGRGIVAPVGWLATGVGVLPVLSDVRRAARILAERRHRWDARSA
jgi:Polyketide cyclase / dehydrase and lipid transport